VVAVALTYLLEKESLAAEARLAAERNRKETPNTRPRLAARS